MKDKDKIKNIFNYCFIRFRFNLLMYKEKLSFQIGKII